MTLEIIAGVVVGFLGGMLLTAGMCSITPGFRWRPVIKAWWESFK